MKHQEVSVDYWLMLKSMITYGALTALGWLMMRLFSMVFSFPGRLRAQQERVQFTLEEIQRRFPDLNITEEDLKDAEKELDELLKEEDDNKVKPVENVDNVKSNSVEKSHKDESKKTI